MDDLFSGIGQIIEDGGNKIIALHNAVVDVVYQVPLTMSEYKQKLDFGEQRFQGPKHERIGGGGMNFALTAASLGCCGIGFAGFMDAHSRGLLEKIRKDNGLTFPISWTQTRHRRNTIMELKDTNILFHDSSASVIDVTDLQDKIRKFQLSNMDWIASCSFYDTITFPMLGLSKRFFLDSGYGYPRRENKMMTKLAKAIESKYFRDFIIAANETELGNIADEFGKKGGNLIEKGQFVTDKLSDMTGNKINILLHTSFFSTVLSPEDIHPWIIPCIDIEVKRRTNAGDTHAGAFMAAYDATNDFRLAVFFANASTANRLSTDELPTIQNTEQFLRKVNLKRVEMTAKSLDVGQLKQILSFQIESSACKPASPLARHPAR